MRTVVTVQEMREAEARVFAAHPGTDLMGRAAAAVARVAKDLAPAGQVAERS